MRNIHYLFEDTSHKGRKYCHLDIETLFIWCDFQQNEQFCRNEDSELGLGDYENRIAFEEVLSMVKNMCNLSRGVCVGLSPGNSTIVFARDIHKNLGQKINYC